MSKQNTKLWDSVCETDPSITTKVNQRGGFTAIAAQSQLRTATEVFGAFGTGWGVSDERIERWEDVGLAVYQATLWYTVEVNSDLHADEKKEVPIHSSIRYHTGSRVDDDFFKKVATDALTKGLSKLGFNADVFLGKFDDNKYVNSMTQKYSVSTDSTKAIAEALKGIPKSDDFYIKVMHALDKGQIGNGNLETSIEKIKSYKDNLKKLKAKKTTKTTKVSKGTQTTMKATGVKNESAVKQ
jgi:hypothetical protein